jgi:catechol 2,3-dioxygenase-like lactoylglutathione lyase family enzyme/uncharacterized protein (DUF1330 family)
MVAMLWLAAPALAQDPLAPRGNGAQALVSPLAAVTIGTADLDLTERFYGGAMGMACARQTVAGASATAFRARLGMGGVGDVQMLTCTRGRAGVTQVRAVLLDAPAPEARPAYQTLLAGALSLGFPSAGNEALDRRVTGLGFRSTAGLTSITLPRGDGSSYTVGEVHYRAPDNVYALGIDRGEMSPVGPIEAGIGVGGPAYAGMIVGDADAAKRLFGDVLGLELRREVQLTSAGPQGGLGLPDNTKFDFQQWYAPGASSGYVILMKFLAGGRAAPVPLGLGARGIGMWSFVSARFDEVLSRARAAGVTIKAAPAPSPWPADNGRRQMVLATGDGFPVEVVEAPPPAPASASLSLDPDVCDNKPVIMLVSGRIKDRERLAAYADAIRASGLYERLGGYYLNNPRKVATFEGSEPDNASTLMVRFPCYAHARAFWYSEKYQKEIVPLRINPNAGDFVVTVYAENPVPPYVADRVRPGGYSWKPTPDVAGDIPRVKAP